MNCASVFWISSIRQNKKRLCSGGFLSALLLAASACAPRNAASAVANCPLTLDSIGEEVVIEAGPVDRSSGAFLPEELAVNGETGRFAIDATEVTNAQFEKFVTATGFTTTAEREGAGGRRLGGAVFDRATSGWRLDEAADWRHPLGAESSIKGKESYPVVQVSYEDALAYAKWVQRRLPTENEWERAARGAAVAPNEREAEAFDGEGAPAANTWQGPFPLQDDAADRYDGAAPVACFAPTQTGLFDMVGNVWEWTADWYAPDALPASESQSAAADVERAAKRVIKGGSHLCAPNYCARYRTRARQAGDPGLGTSHIGFRTVRDLP